jgi:ribosomal protein L11 methyltransferase
MPVKWIETRVVFEGKDKSVGADLIANAFYDQGVKGVVFDDPDLEPDEGWGDGAVPKPERDAVTGYFPDTAEVDELRLRLEAALARLSRVTGLTVHIAYQTVDEEDWAESWKAFFWPQKITDTIVIKPTWRSYRRLPGERIIEIDPGMAFGTGTHPTTALCIRMLEKYFTGGDRHLDIGTGSGILMVAADKFGAERMVGVDNDAVAVGIARRNLCLNGVPASRFDLITGDLTTGICGCYDVITANILSEVILTLLDQIGSFLAPGAIFICSGITEENRERVIAKMTARGITLVEAAVQEQWVAIVGRGPNAEIGLKP